MVNRKRFIARIVILTIIWLSLAVRLGYLAYINESPPDGMLFGPLCGVDAHIYNQYGQDLLQGRWPGSTPLFRTPLYTLYLGLSYTLFGVNHYAPLIVQALIHALATAALAQVGYFIFSGWAGRLAAPGFALYGSLIFYTGCFAQESLAIPLLSLMLFFLLKFRRQAQIRYLMMAALSLGLGTLGRPTLLIMIVVVALWLLFQSTAYRQWSGQTAFFVGVTLLTIAPATLFNYWVSGELILISTNGPEVLFISNNPDAEGRDILAPGIVQPVHIRMRGIVERIGRHETTFTREVLTYIRQQPLDWLALQLNKLWLLFGKSDLNILTPAFKYPTTERQIAIFKTIPIQWHGLIIVAFLGMLLVHRKPSSLLLLYFIFMTAATIIFFVQLRFRLLLAPVILLYAAALLAEMPLWFRSNSPKFKLVLFVLLAAVPFAPEVWPFVLASFGISLWQSLTLNRWLEYRWLFLGLWSLFILAMLSAQIMIEAANIGQQEDYYLGPEIADNLWLGQTFQPDCDQLNRIRLTVGVYHQQHDQPLIFKLRSETTGQEIFMDQFSAEHLSDRAIKEFTFVAQPDSSRQTYLAYVTSPTSHPGNSITLRGFSRVPVDWYPHGTAMIGQGDQRTPFPGDLAFTAFCQMNLGQKIDHAFANLPGSRWVYWFLLAGHTLLFIVAFRQIIQVKIKAGQA